MLDSMATESIVQSLLVDNEGNCVVSCLRYQPINATNFSEKKLQEKMLLFDFITFEVQTIIFQCCFIMIKLNSTEKFSI